MKNPDRILFIDPSSSLVIRSSDPRLAGRSILNWVAAEVRDDWAGIMAATLRSERAREFSCRWEFPGCPPAIHMTRATRLLDPDGTRLIRLDLCAADVSVEAA